MTSPNILITNVCNQRCDFCFAQTEMGNKNIPKEMNLKDYKNLLNRLKKMKTLSSIKLLGGEPMLHSHIKDIIIYTLNHFKTAQIFTNGLFSEKMHTFLKRYGHRLIFIVNISTPGFQENRRLRNIVLKNIKTLTRTNQVVLSITINNGNQGEKTLMLIPKEIRSRIKSVRVGIANPPETNCSRYSLVLLGKKVFQLVKNITTNMPSTHILFNCGFVKCMFTKTQSAFFVKKGVRLAGWGCFGKDSQIDITTDNRAINCYVSSDKERYSVKKQSLSTLEKKLFLVRYKRWLKKNPLSQCLNCKYYQFNSRGCPGPCLG